MVDEEILVFAALRGDESVPLRVVEPLHCSSRHKKTPPLPLMNGRWEALGRPDTRSVKSKRSTGLVSWPETGLAAALLLSRVRASDGDDDAAGRVHGPSGSSQAGHASRLQKLARRVSGDLLFTDGGAATSSSWSRSAPRSRASASATSDWRNFGPRLQARGAYSGSEAPSTASVGSSSAGTGSDVPPRACRTRRGRRIAVFGGLLTPQQIRDLADFVGDNSGSRHETRSFATFVITYLVVRNMRPMPERLVMAYC